MAQIVIVMTAFEPFAERDKNASAEALTKLAALHDMPDVELHTALLPVETGTASEQVRAMLDKHTPDWFIALGEATRTQICLEQIAYNERSYRIPDNAGNVYKNVPIDPGGASSYRATLPIKTMLTALQESGADARLSEDAGRYLCNAIFYSAMQHIDRRNLATRGGFIHIPILPAYAEGPDTSSMPTNQVVRALQVTLTSLCNLPDHAKRAEP